MRGITLFVSICLIFTAICAVPTKHTIQKGSRLSNNENLSTKFGSHNQVKSVISLRHLSTLYTRNYFSDLIRSRLNMSVKELLVKVDVTFKDLDQVTNQGVEALNNVIPLASPEIRNKIFEIKNNVIIKVFETIDEFTSDLGRVLPALPSSYFTHDSSADIVYALLGKTLEELVTAVAKALDSSLKLLDRTIADFRNLATQAKPEVATALYKISDEYLNQGRSIIMPMLHSLGRLVTINKPVHRTQTRKYDDYKYGDLLDGTMSTLLGINVQNVSLETDNALSQLIQLIEFTREELHKALQVHNEDLQAKIINIYDSAVEDVISDTKPIFTNFLLFGDELRHEKTFTYDLGNSLLGIGLENFKAYAQRVPFRVETSIKLASSKIIAWSSIAGLPTLIKDIPMDQSIGSSFLVTFENKEGSWTEDDGFSYNRDPLINSVSVLLGFQVSQATEVLKSSLENLDKLMESSLMELETILSEQEPSLRTDILEIMNETLTDIHITLQPLLDVLLPFLPDLIRLNKEVAVDIYNGINGVNVEGFLRYCSFAAKTVPEITEIATVRIKTAAVQAGPNIHTQIESLLRTCDNHTKAIIKPFLEIASPLISPL